LSDISSVDEESDYEEDDYEEEEIDIIDIDLLLKIRNNNEMIFMNFIKDNNISEDFINSKFNIIDKSAYNYVINKTCNCENEYDICSNDDNTNCKNYQNFILENPINYMIYKKDCPCCNEQILEDIKKYNLFSFDGKINKLENNIEEKIVAKKSSIFANKLANTSISKYQVIQFLNLYKYIFKYGYTLLNNDKFRNTFFNKLLTEGNKDSVKEYIPYWANLFNFDSNIINIMIDNLKENFAELNIN